MSNFEQIISEIDNKISIKKEDREVYTKDFDIIRNYLLQNMKEEDPVFQKIYAGPSLFGSYAENLKTDVPDEFDVHFLLKLPFYEHMKVESDKARPGFVRIDLSKMLPLMKADLNLYFVYERLEQFVNRENLLCRHKLQNWLQKIIEKTLKEHGNHIQNSTGSFYTLTYTKRGTAHTIKATSLDRCISIDFVPAIKFDANNYWLADRSFPEEITEKLWFAVPKPTVGPRKDRFLTFSICVPQIEKHLLNNKYNLKSSMRLFKSLRDKTSTSHLLKSYFIRSIYLIENDNQNDDFWMQPPGKLLIYMLGRLLDFLDKGFIPFYWCPTLNLMGGLKPGEILTIKTEFQLTKSILESYSNQKDINAKQFRRLFLRSQKPLKKELA